MVRWKVREPTMRDRSEFQFRFFREQWLAFAVYIVVAVAILAGLGYVFDRSPGSDMLRYALFAAWLYVAMEFLNKPARRRGILRVRRQQRWCRHADTQ